MTVVDVIQPFYNNEVCPGLQSEGDIGVPSHSSETIASFRTSSCTLEREIVTSPGKKEMAANIVQ